MTIRKTDERQCGKEKHGGSRTAAKIPAVKRLRDNPTEEKRKEWSVHEGAVDRSQREQQESGMELRTVGI